MKRSSRELKALARDTLANRYGSFIGTLIVYFLIVLGSNMLLTFAFPFRGTVISSIIAWLASFIITLIISVFSVGLIRFSLNMCRGEQYRLSDLFFGFRTHPDKIIIAQLILTLISEICSIPVTIMDFMSSSNTLTLDELSFRSLVILACSFLNFVVTLGLHLTMYLLCDYDNPSAVQALRESWHLMRGNKGRLFYLSLSFFGIFLLGFLSCGIGFLWALPYWEITFSYFYLDIIGEL